jgi:preprotein translocase subunit SecE
MGKFRTYIDETTNELFHKVSWPTWSELQGSAIVVMIASIIIALIIFVMDFTFNKGMEAIYHLFL